MPNFKFGGKYPAVLDVDVDVDAYKVPFNPKVFKIQTPTLPFLRLRDRKEFTQWSINIH